MNYGGGSSGGSAIFGILMLHILLAGGSGMLAFRSLIGGLLIFLSGSAVLMFFGFGAGGSEYVPFWVVFYFFVCFGWLPITVFFAISFIAFFRKLASVGKKLEESQQSDSENSIPSGTSDAKASGTPDSRGL